MADTDLDRLAAPQQRVAPAKAKGVRHDIRGYADQQVMEWNRSAVRRRGTSHTARYQGEAAFKAQCIASHKAEWLMWASGRWVGIDGCDIQPSE